MAPPTLQRLASSPSRVSTLVHATGLLLFTASISWVPQITNPLHNGFGGSYQFLTIIALTISTITFGVGLLADLFLSQRLVALKNILSLCVTPLEVLVSIMYWNLRAVDKTFVVPPGHELPFIPDLGFHALPAIMLTIDSMLLSPPWKIKVSYVIALHLAFIFLYWGWVEYCFSHNGWYPYPLLTLLSCWKKMFLCITSAALMTSSTMILKWMYGQFNGFEELRRGVFVPFKID